MPTEKELEEIIQSDTAHNRPQHQPRGGSLAIQQKVAHNSN